MNKEVYIKPELTVEEFIAEPLMLIASNTEYDTTKDIQRTSGRRGTWGNLWDEGK